MKKRLLLGMLAISLLAPWPVAYAYGNSSTPRDIARVEAAPPTTTPRWTTYGGAIGGVTTPGDLFYVDAASSAADLTASLYLTNASELVHAYRYLILKVGVYQETSPGAWERANSHVPDTYLTLQGGKVDLTLPGRGRYKVGIDSGSFYAYPVGPGVGSVSPSFYLSVE